MRGIFESKKSKCQEVLENYIIRSFMIRNVNKILSGAKCKQFKVQLRAVVHKVMKLGVA